MYVAMLHSVGCEKSTWNWKWLSMSLEHFENLCQYLANNDYTTHHLDEWYDYYSKFNKKDRKKIVLTFDDGYLDNWVYVYPILKRYNLKATIFINPEFVDPSLESRKNLEDVNFEKKQFNEDDALGFLNWQEIKLLDSHELIDIQSHSMTHNFYFKSNRIIDLYTGQPKYDWLSWNLFPDSKPFSLNERTEKKLRHGYPIFEYDRALGIKRYIPDEKLINNAVTLYSNKKSNQKDIKEELQKTIDEYPGRFETHEEMMTRYRYELIESKKVIEEKLNKTVNYLCWPGGGYNSKSLFLAKEAGYKASTYGSSDKNNNPGLNEKYKRIPRFGLSSFINLNHKYLYSPNPKHVVNQLKSRTGNFSLKVIMKIKKEYLKLLEVLIK